MESEIQERLYQSACDFVSGWKIIASQTEILTAVRQACEYYKDDD